MGVTNFYTENGRIRGESTGGVRTNYLTDALGSVTATVNSSSSIVNTYRYKPYGTLLTKTGAAADPNFTWLVAEKCRVGLSGTYYWRSAHFKSSIGEFTTPILEGSPNPYMSNIMRQGRRKICGVDIPFSQSKKLSVSATFSAEPLKASNCCYADFTTHYRPEGKFGQFGSVIQRVNMRYKVVNCADGSIIDEESGVDYLEAWGVINGRTVKPASADNFKLGPGPSDCVCGFYRAVGYPVYFDECVVEATAGYWGPGKVKRSGILLSMWTATVPGWVDGPNVKILDYKFDCCDCKSNFKAIAIWRTPGVPYLLVFSKPPVPVIATGTRKKGCEAGRCQ